MEMILEIKQKVIINEENDSSSPSLPHINKFFVQEIYPHVGTISTQSF